MGKVKSSRRSGEVAVASASSSSSAMTSSTIAGFHILPLDLPSTSLEPSPIHYLYLRPHNVKPSTTSAASSSSSQLPRGRTLFVANLPVDTTDRHWRALFEKAGRIEDVRIKRGKANDQGAQEGAEESDDGSSDEEMEQDEDRVDPSNALLATKPTRKSRKGKGADKPTIPSVTPLPPLDPRKDQAFLQTGSTGHLVFLEEGSISKVLALCSEAASSSKPRRWLDPSRALLDKTAASADQEEGSSSKRPATAKEAQRASLQKEPPAPLGLAYFLARHDTLRPALPLIKSHADSSVKRYTFLRSHPHLDPERSANGGIGQMVGGIKIASYGPEGEPLDEDGFTIVLPGGKYGRSLGSAGGAVKFARRSKSEIEEELKKSKAMKGQMEGLEDFYRFQTRERRKEKLADMRRQFEEDRLKIEKLKDAGGEKGGKRRFKPY